MKKKNIFQLFLSGVICLLCTTSCSVEPDFYSQVVPETFYSSQDAVWQRFNRPFTHWRWYIAHDSPRWLLQELGTDEFCLPTRGSDWYDGAVYQKFHHHEYTEDMTRVETGWTNFAMGVALAWDALEDLENVDFDALGFEEGTRESMLNQQRTLAASFYLDGLDFFGGVPLYTTTQSEVKGRSTDVETFNFIDSLLKIAVPNLPIKEELGGMETGSIHRAAGAALQARLYFNAKSYIGKEMFTEAAQICQDIIDGKYGQYALETDWTNIFGFDNERCPELIWSVPSQNAKTETDAMYWGMMVPYNYKNYLGGLEGSGSDNALGLVPSLDPTGKRYPYKLGGAYAKFNDKEGLIVNAPAPLFPHIFPLLAAVGFLCTGRRAVSLPPIRGNGPAADRANLKIRPGPLGQEGGLQRRIKGQHRLPKVAAQRPRPAFPQHIALTVQGQAAALPVIVGTPFCHQGADRPFFLACQFTGQAVTSRQPGPA